AAARAERTRRAREPRLGFDTARRPSPAPRVAAGERRSRPPPSSIAGPPSTREDGARSSVGLARGSRRRASIAARASRVVRTLGRRAYAPPVLRSCSGWTSLAEPAEIGRAPEATRGAPVSAGARG